MIKAIGKLLFERWVTPENSGRAIAEKCRPPCLSRQDLLVVFHNQALQLQQRPHAFPGTLPDRIHLQTLLPRAHTIQPNLHARRQLSPRQLHSHRLELRMQRPRM